MKLYMEDETIKLLEDKGDDYYDEKDSQLSRRMNLLLHNRENKKVDNCMNSQHVHLLLHNMESKNADDDGIFNK